MTKIIYFSGVHGVGKTTVLNHVAGELEACGMSVYVFPEMSYFPKIKIETMGFQIWLKKQVSAREIMIDALIKSNTFDYILLDRHEFDVDIYTRRLSNERRIHEHAFRKGASYFILTAKIDVLIDRIRARENAHDREDWNELDVKYLNEIRSSFIKYAEAMKSIVKLIETDDDIAYKIALYIMELIY